MGVVYLCVGHLAVTLVQWATVPRFVFITPVRDDRANPNHMEQQPSKPNRKFKKRYILYAVIALFIIGVIATPSDEKAKAADPKQQVSEPTVAKPPSDTKKDEIVGKLKTKAAKDWPNDFTTQEYWVNQQIEDYEFMLTVEDNSIKQKAQRDWPLDFSTQKYWYNEQIEAKERLK